MDPITAVGAIASVLQLAGTALSLSKGLYEVSSAVATATEEINSLAHDLALFSESLTLLSRMLEAKQEQYSGAIYQLTAKIVVDCGEICAKIETVIEKLKRKGLGSKFKWVYREKENIKKLLERLRDLKLTLLLILSNLQLDQLLSQMSIKSSSIIECPDTSHEILTAANLSDSTFDVTRSHGCSTLPILEQALAARGIQKTGPNEDVKIHCRGGQFQAENLEQRDVKQEVQAVQPLEIPVMHQPTSLNLSAGFLKETPPPNSRSPSISLSTPSQNQISLLPTQHPHIGEQQQPATAQESPQLRLARPFSKPSNERNRPSYIPHPSVDEVDEPLWPMSQVLAWLRENHFSSDWQQTFKGLGLEGPKFLELSVGNGDRGNLGMMYNLVYPRLATECTASGTGWNQAREREEGHRMLGLICGATRGQESQQVSEPQFKEAMQNTQHRTPILPATATVAPRDGNAVLESSRIRQPHYNSSSTTRGGARSRRPAPNRTNEYFVPKEGIDREVITADICRYLGNDALVRPGNYESPRTGNIMRGYFVTAHRNLTVEMIADLKADSERWEAEKKQAASRGRDGVEYRSSTTHQSRQYYGPTNASNSGFGDPQPQVQSQPNAYGEHYSQPNVGGYAQASSQSQVQPQGNVHRRLYGQSSIDGYSQAPAHGGNYFTQGRDLRPSTDVRLQVAMLSEPETIHPILQPSDSFYSWADPYDTSTDFYNTGDYSQTTMPFDTSTIALPDAQFTTSGFTIPSSRNETLQQKSPTQQQPSKIQSDNPVITFPNVQPAASNDAQPSSRHATHQQQPSSQPPNQFFAITEKKRRANSQREGRDDMASTHHEPLNSSSFVYKIDDGDIDERPAKRRRLKREIVGAWGSALNSLEIFTQTTGLTGFRYPSTEQLSQLWWKGLINFRKTDHMTSIRVHNHLHDSGLVPVNTISNEDWDTQLQKFQQTKTIVSDLDNDLNEASAIFELVSETIGFKTASYAWACVASLIWFPSEPFAHNPEFTQQLLIIVSIVARYTVMENIYQKWDGISLSIEFKDKMIDLCTKILTYVDVAIQVLKSQNHVGISDQIEMPDHDCLRIAYMNVLEADRKCRAFTVIIETNEEKRKTDDTRQFWILEKFAQQLQNLRHLLPI